MTLARCHPAALAGLAALIAGLAMASPAAADVAAGAVQLWLRQMATSLAANGYQLSWDGVSGQSAGVTVSGLRGADREGRHQLSVATLTVTRPTLAANGTLTAQSLALDALALRGGDTIDTVEADRITIGKPDLAAILALLADAAPRDGAGWTRAMSGDLDLRSLRLRGSAAPEPGAAPEPFHLRVARLTAAGVQPEHIAHLEIDGLTMAAEPAGGDLATMSVERIRGTDLGGRSLTDTASGDPRTVRPLSALAELRIGALEFNDIRSASALSGTTTIRRQWMRTRTVEAGRSGVLQFGAEGITSSADQADNPLAPFMTALFPPAGLMSLNWAGDLAYDARAGSVALRQDITAERFAGLAINLELTGIPDLTVAEWEAVRQDDPRLARMQVRGLSLALTDTGGGDRTVKAMSEDRQASAKALRAGFAEQLGALAAAFNPKRDPVLAGWVKTLQDFVRNGGTLAFAAAKPIPMGAAASQSGDPASLADLARRYGLTLDRR